MGNLMSTSDGEMVILRLLCDLCRGSLQTLKRRQHRAIEPFAVVGQPDLFAVTVEQGAAEPFLERSHMAADRRL